MHVARQPVAGIPNINTLQRHVETDICKIIHDIVTLSMLQRKSIKTVALIRALGDDIVTPVPCFKESL